MVVSVRLSLRGVTRAKVLENLPQFLDAFGRFVDAQATPELVRVFDIGVTKAIAKQTSGVGVDLTVKVRTVEQVQNAVADAPALTETLAASIDAPELNLEATVDDTTTKEDTSGSSNLPVVVGVAVGGGAGLVILAAGFVVWKRQNKREPSDRRVTQDAKTGRVFVDKEFFENETTDKYKDKRSSTTHVPLEDIVARSSDDEDSQERKKHDSFRQVINALHDDRPVGLHSSFANPVARHTPSSISAALRAEVPAPMPANGTVAEMSDYQMPKLRDKLNEDNRRDGMGLRVGSRTIIPMDDNDNDTPAQLKRVGTGNGEIVSSMKRTNSLDLQNPSQSYDPMSWMMASHTTGGAKADSEED